MNDDAIGAAGSDDNFDDDDDGGRGGDDEPLNLLCRQLRPQSDLEHRWLALGTTSQPLSVALSRALLPSGNIVVVPRNVPRTVPESLRAEPAAWLLSPARCSLQATPTDRSTLPLDPTAPRAADIHLKKVPEPFVEISVDREAVTVAAGTADNSAGIVVMSSLPSGFPEETPPAVVPASTLPFPAGVEPSGRTMQASFPAASSSCLMPFVDDVPV